MSQYDANKAGSKQNANRTNETCSQDATKQNRAPANSDNCAADYQKNHQGKQPPQGGEQRRPQMPGQDNPSRKGNPNDPRDRK